MASRDEKILKHFHVCMYLLMPQVNAQYFLIKQMKYIFSGHLVLAVQDSPIGDLVTHSDSYNDYHDYNDYHITVIIMTTETAI